MNKKLVTVISIILVMSLSLAGCGSKLDGTATVATMDETAIPLSEVNFLLRYQQAQMESYYSSMFGENVFNQDLYGDGTIYGESVKTSVMESFEEYYILAAEAENYGVSLTDDEKAAISAAAESFLSGNENNTEEAFTASAETIEHVLSLITIDSKVHAALIADVDTNVSDEEAAQKKIVYVNTTKVGTETDEDGNTIDLTEEELAANKASLQGVLDAALESNDLTAAAEAAEMTANTATYGADDTSLPDEVKAAADQLAEGEYGSEVIDTEYGYYIVQLVSNFDEEATAAKKESIIAERENTLFDEKYAELQKGHTFEIVDEVLALITFDRTFTAAAAE